MTEKQYLEAVQRVFVVLENIGWALTDPVISLEAKDETERRLAALKAQEDNIKSDHWEEKK